MQFETNEPETPKGVGGRLERLVICLCDELKITLDVVRNAYYN